MKRAQKTAAFYVEALLLTLFLLAALTVLVQVFGAARRMGTLAKQKTEASLAAENACALFMAETSPFDTLPDVGQTEQRTLAFAENGTQNGEGPYMVTVQLTAQKTDAGRIVTAEFAVHTAESAEPEPLCRLSAEKYKPK